MLIAFHCAYSELPIACILSALSFLRGPLSQAASSVAADQLYFPNDTISLAIAQRLPDKYTALTGEIDIDKASGLAENFSKIMQEHSVRAPIHFGPDNHFCDQNNCTTFVKVSLQFRRKHN